MHRVCLFRSQGLPRDRARKPRSSGVGSTPGVSRQPRTRLNARIADHGERRDAARWTRRLPLVRSSLDMRPTPEADADDLDLPPLDGTVGGADADEENEGISHAEDDLDADAVKDHGDAFDDATGEGDALDEITVEGAEGGWL